MSGELPVGRTLFLLRHAKSDWDAGVEDDHSRPLAKRGRKAAQRIGRFLATLEPPPSRVLCSTALRARETLERALEAGGLSCAVEFTDALYDTTPAATLALLRGLEDDDPAVLLVGHEPTWSELVAELTGGCVRMPTAALARIDFAADRWGIVAPGSGSLSWLVTPKLLRASGGDPD